LTKKLTILLLLLWLVVCNSGTAQNLHTTSNQALKAYNEGKQAYDFLDIKNAEKFLREAISIDRKFYEA